MIITPEEAVYTETKNRDHALASLAEQAYERSQGHFTRSTVILNAPIVPWSSELVPPTLRTVVDYCIAKGAYKPFRGSTAGHFAVKLGPDEFLTSRRKTNFNDMGNVGLVRVKTKGDNEVFAEGGKPSVGGQSQRIVFAEHPEADCIVHFHCPPTQEANVHTAYQWAFECGSHECGQNTSRNLVDVGNGIKAVYLDNHGPNIVFPSSVDPQDVIQYIDTHFDLSQKSGGYQL